MSILGDVGGVLGKIGRETNTPTVGYPRAMVVFRPILEDLQEVVGGPRGDQMLTLRARPHAAKVVRNSYSKPDSFSVEVMAHDMPFNPKQFRAVGVEVYLWHDRGGIQRGTKENWAIPPGMKPKVAGIADDNSMAYSDDGATLVIDGQDYTAVLSDKHWRRLGEGVSRRMPSGQRIDVLLEGMLREADPGNVLRLRVEPAGLHLPIVGAAHRRTNKKGIPVKDDDSYWDVMYQMAQLEGFILFIEGTDVVLSEPRALVDGRASRAARFAWGRNLTNLEIRRHMGKETTPTIEVRCCDSRGQVIKARYPNRGERAHTGIGTTKDQFKILTPRGLHTEAACRRYAQSYYEHVSRGEIEISLSTSSLLDLDGNDIGELQGGDCAYVDLDPFNRAELANMTAPQRVEYLTRVRGYDVQVAKSVATNYDLAKVLQGPYRVSEATYTYSVDDGITTDLSVQEYIRTPEAS